MKHQITFDSLTEEQKEEMATNAKKLITKHLITAAGIKIGVTVASAILIKAIEKKLDLNA